MVEWLKKHKSLLIGLLVTVGFFFYCYGCEPKTQSLLDIGKQINRQELQLELDQVISMSQLRLADLDRQEQIRAIVLQNALILVQGQPLNPLGIITAIAGIYGVMQGSSNVTKVVKTKLTKRKENHANT